MLECISKINEKYTLVSQFRKDFIIILLLNEMWVLVSVGKSTPWQYFLHEILKVYINLSF